MGKPFLAPPAVATRLDRLSLQPPKRWLSCQWKGCNWDTHAPSFHFIAPVFASVPAHYVSKGGDGLGVLRRHHPGAPSMHHPKLDDSGGLGPSPGLMVVRVVVVLQMIPVSVAKTHGSQVAFVDGG